MRLASTTLLIVFATALCCSQQAPLFPLPQRLLRVWSETVLSGIDLYSTEPDRVTEMFGKATRLSKARGAEQFEWQSHGCTLTIVTRGKWITSINVRGNRRDCEFGSTGRGVRLGDTIDRARKIYSSFKYSPRLYPVPTIFDPRSAYAPDCPLNPVLDIEANVNGTVTQMTLRDRTICY